jgi:hypothetical protein
MSSKDRDIDISHAGFWSNYVVLVFLIIAGFSSCFGAPRVIPWQIAGENPNSVKTAARV